MRALQKLVEEIPAGHPARRLAPHVRAVHRPVDAPAAALERLLYHARVLAVVRDPRVHLALARFGVDGGRPALDDVARAVELRRLAPQPHRVQVLPVALQLARHDRVAAACAREARRLGKRAELDGAGARPVDLEDAVRHVRLHDEALVGRVEHDDRPVLVGVVHPTRELLGRQHGARRVVGRAQVDDIDRLFGNGGEKAVFGSRGHVADLRPRLRALAPVARAAGHGVRVHVDGVDRVAHGDGVVHGEDVADVAAIAFRTVGDEDLVDVHLHPARVEVVFADGLAQEIVALLRAVAVEGLGPRHVVDCRVHGLDHGGRERARDVADAHLHQLDIRVRLLERLRAPRYLGEKVAAGQLRVVLVHVGHVSALLAVRAAHRTACGEKPVLRDAGARRKPSGHYPTFPARRSARSRRRSFPLPHRR